MSSPRYKALNQENYNKNASEHNKLSIDSTQYLVYQDFKKLFQQHSPLSTNASELRVLDFGCGSGLSTQTIFNLLQDLNLTPDITGIDINTQTIQQAKERVPNANFLTVQKEDNLDHLGKFDLIVCNFVLVELKEKDMKFVLEKINSLLSDTGIAMITNCASKTYRSGIQWATLNTDFEENKPTELRNGKLKITEDHPVKNQVFDSFKKNSTFTFFDFFHSGEAYRRCFESSGLSLMATHKPIARESKDIPWADELKHSPYKIHIVKRTSPNLTLKHNP